MAIDLEYPNSQLLLLNRSQQEEFLHCPSFGLCTAILSWRNRPFCCLKRILGQIIKARQILFLKKLGKEEFLAIALEKPVNLPWLIPREEEALPEWNAERLKELFEQLEKQDNWQVFYQSFEVVEK
jgi:hypothetical protein